MNTKLFCDKIDDFIKTKYGSVNVIKKMSLNQKQELYTQLTNLGLSLYGSHETDKKKLLTDIKETVRKYINNALIQ